MPGLEYGVICGDCRDSAAVTRLLGGRKVNMVITSPPYASQRKYDESSGFKPIPPEEYVVWYKDVARTIETILAPDGSYFLNIKAHADEGERNLYVMDLVLAHKRQWGWQFRDEFIWKHSGFPGEYKFRHRNQFEPIFHFSRQHVIKHNPYAVGVESEMIRDNGGGRKKGGGRMVATNQEDDRDAGKALPFRSGIAQVGNVLEIAVNAESTGHKAVFPRGLPEFFIKAFTDPGDVIFDPFLGSGTTMIAAMALGRSCFGTELSPGYCDVIVNRAEAFSKMRATLAGDGRTFGAIAEERQQVAA
jgi:site-specific DNA-methyltransferase (adenine-specific)